MKKLITILGIFLAFVITAKAQNSEIRNVGSFNEVKVGESVRVILVPGNKEEVKVEVEGVDVVFGGFREAVGDVGPGFSGIPAPGDVGKRCPDWRCS